MRDAHAIPGFGAGSRPHSKSLPFFWWTCTDSNRNLTGCRPAVLPVKLQALEKQLRSCRSRG